MKQQSLITIHDKYVSVWRTQNQRQGKDSVLRCVYGHCI